MHTLNPFPSFPPPFTTHSLDDISKGAIYIESDKCARARVARFIAMTGQYAALCIASGVRSQELWTSFMSSMGLEQNTQVTDAQSTLTGASSMHGLDAVAGSPNSLHVPTQVMQGTFFRPSGAAASSQSPAPQQQQQASPSSQAMFSGSSEPATAAPLFGGDSAGAVDL